MTRRWGDLSERSRRLIIATAIGEAVLKTAVLVDIRRRPVSEPGPCPGLRVGPAARGYR
jgi:hypothetical protein